MTYDAALNSTRCWSLAIAELRAELEKRVAAGERADDVKADQWRRGSKHG